MSRFLVAGLSDADMIWLLSRGKLRTLKAGERLVDAGRPIADLFFVLTGTLEVLRQDGARVATLGEGQVVGEMSFVEEHAPSVSVRADGRCEILGTPRGEILERFAADPLFAARFYRALAVFLSDRLRDTTAALGAAVPAPRTDAAAAASAGARFRRLLGSLTNTV